MERGQRLRVPVLHGLAQDEEALHGEVAPGPRRPFLHGLLGVHGQRRRRAVGLGVRETAGRQGEHGVAGLGQPAVLHEHDDAQPVLVDQAVHGSRGEPHERARGQRGLLESGGREGLHGAAAADHDVPLRAGQVQVGVPPRSPSAAGQS